MSCQYLHNNCWLKSRRKMRRNGSNWTHDSFGFIFLSQFLLSQIIGIFLVKLIYPVHSNSMSHYLFTCLQHFAIMYCVIFIYCITNFHNLYLLARKFFILMFKSILCIYSLSKIQNKIKKNDRFFLNIDSNFMRHIE